MTVVVAAVSDLHTNSTIGLCPPRFRLDDGGDYVASKAQRWLWRNWHQYVRRVQELATEHDAQIVTVFNGDIADGDHHNTPQIITRNHASMIRLAYDVMGPLVDISDQVYIVRGTEAHTGKSAWIEEAIADDLENAVHDKQSGTASWWHLLLDVDGVLFDVAHHRTGGNLPHTKPNIANRLAMEAVYNAAVSGSRPPDVLLRAHKHTFIDSGRNYPVRVIGMPAFQLATAFVHRIVPGSLADIGGLAFVVNEGSYTFEDIRFKPTRPQTVRVKL